jgi:hypothetical protein
VLSGQDGNQDVTAGSNTNSAPTAASVTPASAAGVVRTVMAWLRRRDYTATENAECEENGKKTSNAEIAEIAERKNHSAISAISAFV